MFIKYFADIRELTGRKEEEWPNASPNLGALLAGLALKHGARFKQRVFADDEAERLSGSIIILVNGQSVEHLSGLGTPLHPDDVVVIFPMVAGG